MAEQEMKNWLDQRAFLTPGRIALIFEGQKWTYQELNQDVRSMACKLSMIGVKKGQHIGFLMDNHPDTVILIHALHYLHVVMVPLNKRLSVGELDYQLKDADVDRLIVDSGHIEKGQALHFNQIIKIDEVKGIEKEADIELNDVIQLEDLHTIVYTSGTTGYPKGVMLTYGNHWWSATGSALNLGIREDDRWLCMVPLFHVSGLSIIMRSVICGITMVLHSAFDAVKFNESIEKDKVTIASVVSVMLSKVLNTEGFRGYPSAFRCMLLGGGPAPFPLLKQCEENDIPVFQTYGLSESASQIVTLAPEDSFRKLGSAGKPLFPSQIKIGKSDGDRDEGEIFVKGPNVTQGYYKKPSVNETKIKDGWLATGDIGYLDDEGFLFVLDRRKDMFVSGGENVYPAEIEACLIGHEAVSESGVIGIDEDVWGKAPAAFVVLNPGFEQVTVEELTEYCKDHLAGYKVPKLMKVMDELPKNASNKLLRRDLYHLLEEGDCDEN